MLEEIVATFHRYLGDGMRIDVELVRDIELGATGKRLASVSHLAVDFQTSAPDRLAADG